MNIAVRQAVESMLRTATHAGSLAGRVELNDLQAKLSNSLPDWYVELMAAFPIAGMDLEFPLYDPDDDDDGYVMITIARITDIYFEMEEAYPGLAIKDMGYVCLATDPTGGGDPYFMKVREGDNPPVYQVYHDVGNTGSEIEAYGMVKIADTLADFFLKSRVDD